MAAPGCGEQWRTRAVLQLPEALSRNVAPRGPASARNDESPAGAGFLRCAEEDSNLHPVIPDQALNLVGQAVGRC